MKKKAKRKLPIAQFAPAVVLGSILFGAGIYAYQKQHTLHMASLEQVKSWFAANKVKSHEAIKTIKKIASDEEPTQDKVKFEFYDSLANPQVQMMEADKSPTSDNAPKAGEQIKKVANVTPEIADRKELEQEFLEKMADPGSDTN